MVVESLGTKKAGLKPTASLHGICGDRIKCIGIEPAILRSLGSQNFRLDGCLFLEKILLFLLNFSVQMELIEYVTREELEGRVAVVLMVALLYEVVTKLRVTELKKEYGKQGLCVVGSRITAFDIDGGFFCYSFSFCHGFKTWVLIFFLTFFFESDAVVALMTIKNNLNDPYNVLENWDINSVDPCSWRMVTCSSDGYVSALGLPSQSLSGTLSPWIGNLTNLQSV
ncbi:Protein NSP-interacting kinase 3 [Vitis vinifera]|uniref:Protein NSP-interacting kinase 3 n=1 Tax=Vitis vinifera TaxID=29760 RepID=A0A438J5Z7_VITVI|nr:Protein NSP-interacting kinase 3 [Vitis vinifera]